MMRSRRIFWCYGGVLALVAASVLGVKAQAEMQFEVKPLGGANTATSTEQQSSEIQAIDLLRRTGHYDEAEARGLQILKQKPDDPTIKRLLAEIQSERGRQQSSSASLRRRIESLVIPEVNVRGASVIEVVDFLKEQGQTLSVDKAPINIVWEAPEETKTAKVTMSLREVPLAEALRYVTESVGLRYRVDAHAIVIYIPPPAAPPHAKP